MKHIIHFEPLTPTQYKTYIKIGVKAYNQHYLHLWPNEDSTPYIQSSFTRKVLKNEETDKNTQLFLINRNTECVGILKFTVARGLNNFSKKDALYIDKIYLTKEACSLGIGTKTLNFVMLRAKALQKRIVWLDTMQKGPALNFYIKNGFSISGTTEIHFKQAIETEKPMFIMAKEI